MIEAAFGFSEVVLFKVVGCEIIIIISSEVAFPFSEACLFKDAGCAIIISFLHWRDIPRFISLNK